MPVDAMHPNGVRRNSGAIIAHQMADLSGGSVTVQNERAWASITFTGTRYSLSIDWAGAAKPDVVQNLAQTLPDHEFAIPGYFVADILVTEQTEFRLLVDVLSIIDPAGKIRVC